MAFELQNILQACMLESGARDRVLSVIAGYADIDTGIARISRMQLAAQAKLSERSVRRAMADLLSDPELEGLLQLVKPGNGRTHVAVYRIDLKRLEPLSDAIRAAGRRIFAGVAAGMLDFGLARAKASPDNIRAVFALLDRLLAAENEQAARRLVSAHREAFETVMQERGNVAVIGRPAEAVPGPPAGAPAPVEKPVKSGAPKGDAKPGKGDRMSVKGDILSNAHNKDTYPSGIITSGRSEVASPARACGRILAGAGTASGDFVFDGEGAALHAALSRSARLAMLRDLQGRMARVTPDGVLAIRSRSEADGAAMAARWLETLLGWASDIGLSGVVFDAPFRPDG